MYNTSENQFRYLEDDDVIQLGDEWGDCIWFPCTNSIGYRLGDYDHDPTIKFRRKIKQTPKGNLRN